MSRKNLQHLTFDFSAKEDSKTFNHEGFVAGVPPYLRGPYSTMYVRRPMDYEPVRRIFYCRKKACLYRRNLAAGQKGLSVAFDLATHRGYDSDHERVQREMLVKQEWPLTL